MLTDDPHISNRITDEPDRDDVDIVITTIEISGNSKLAGQSILDSGIREKTNGLVIGIERDNQRIVNPVSSVTFQKGDVVWVAAEKEKLQNFDTVYQRRYNQINSCCFSRDLS